MITSSNLVKRSPLHEGATPTKNWLGMTLGRLSTLLGGGGNKIIEFGPIESSFLAKYRTGCAVNI